MKKRDYIELSYLITDVKTTIRFDKECLLTDFKAYKTYKTLTNKEPLSIRDYLKVRVINSVLDYIEGGRKEGWFIHL